MEGGTPDGRAGPVARPAALRKRGCFGEAAPHARWLAWIKGPEGSRILRLRPAHLGMWRLNASESGSSNQHASMLMTLLTGPMSM
jgi:hypothetical protein